MVDKARAVTTLSITRSENPSSFNFSLGDTIVLGLDFEDLDVRIPNEAGELVDRLLARRWLDECRECLEGLSTLRVDSTVTLVTSGIPSVDGIGSTDAVVDIGEDMHTEPRSATELSRHRLLPPDRPGTETCSM